MKQQHSCPTGSLSALHFVPQVPDVWWWPWPAVTGVADCLSCPLRNQEDWPVSGLPEQRTVGEYTLLVPTGPMTLPHPQMKIKEKKKKKRKNRKKKRISHFAHWWGPPSLYRKEGTERIFKGCQNRPTYVLLPPYVVKSKFVHLCFFFCNSERKFE